jgi:hypothetical protein
MLLPLLAASHYPLSLFHSTWIQPRPLISFLLLNIKYIHIHVKRKKKW